MSDEEILRIFLEHPDPVLSKNEVAEKIDIGPEGTYKRLQELVDGGLLERKQPHPRATVYWITDGGRAYVSSRKSEAENE